MKSKKAFSATSCNALALAVAITLGLRATPIWAADNAPDDTVPDAEGKSEAEVLTPEELDSREEIIDRINPDAVEKRDLVPADLPGLDDAPVSKSKPDQGQFEDAAGEKRDDARPIEQADPGSTIPEHMGTLDDSVDGQSNDAPGASGPEPSAPPPPTPAEVLDSLVGRGIYPEEASQNPTGNVSRAELAKIMIAAMGYPVEYVSEFPFYRDVPLTHPDYAAIETARVRNLVVPRQNGFYYPDDPITFMTVYWALSNALIARNLSVDSARTLLEPFEDNAALNDLQATRVALLVNARVIPTTLEEDPLALQSGSPRLRPTENATYLSLAPLLGRMLYVTTRRPFFITEAAPDYRDVAARVTLQISPTSSIFAARLDVGDGLYFTLEETDADLPKGSRLHGRVISVNADGTYRIKLDELKTVSGETRDILAYLQLKFPAKDAEAFIVPGQLFEIVTEAVPGGPSTAPRIELPSSEPPPAPPAGSSGSISAPNSAPRSPESSESAP